MSQIFTPERLIVYVVASDDGLAPNVSADYCSLTVCKPVVRRVARPLKDWVVGMSTNKHGATKLIYTMQVEEKLPYNAFFKDSRFELKKPCLKRPFGDNFILNDEAVLPWACHYSKPGKMRTNLKTPFSLIGQNYWYFGCNAPILPKDMWHTKLVQGPRRGHKIVDNPAHVANFYHWIKKNFNTGVHGAPRDQSPFFS